jgi:nicotinamide mononucleotide (NMN) deamidase PncC
VALRLARNLKLELGSTYALSETGWAGPTAGGDETVGSAFFAIASPQQNISTSKLTGLTSRSDNMVEFAKLALEFLLEFLEQPQE